MNGWRGKLRKIFQLEKNDLEDITTQETSVKLAEVNIGYFLKDIVVPAYNDLKMEIEKYGRIVVIDIDDSGLGSASLTVYLPSEIKTEEQVEEFYFLIEGRAYQKAGFAFPEHADESLPRTPQVEISIRNGSIGEHDIENLSKDDIIKIFVDEYSKWINY